MSSYDERAFSNTRQEAGIPNTSNLRDVNLRDLKKLQESICEKMTLNFEQEATFRIISDHSISRLQMTSEPIKLYLGGRGGTGKSRVIEALKSWIRDIDQQYRF